MYNEIELLCRGEGTTIKILESIKTGIRIYTEVPCSCFMCDDKNIANTEIRIFKNNMNESNGTPDSYFVRSLTTH